MPDTATVRSNTLTDGSITHDVIYTTSDGYTITIGAMSEEAASALRDALDNAAFVEIDPRGAA